LAGVTVAERHEEATNGGDSGRGVAEGHDEGLSGEVNGSNRRIKRL
jgi:hypothetical protein